MLIASSMMAPGGPCSASTSRSASLSTSSPARPSAVFCRRSTRSSARRPSLMGGAAAFPYGWRRCTRGRPHAIDLVGLVHLMKRLGKRADAFRWAEYQETRWLEGVMQDRQHLALQFGSKVDQHVAATDKVQPGERRVLGHVVPCKNA